METQKRKQAMLEHSVDFAKKKREKRRLKCLDEYQRYLDENKDYLNTS